MRTTTGLLLSAAMLFGSIVPPGRRHAHAGGELAHTHHQEQEHEHSHGGRHHHHHGHHHHPHQHDGANEPGLPVEAVEPAAIAHVHFAFWLFDFTLPVRNDSDTDDSEPVYLVRLIDDCLPGTVTSPGPQTVASMPPLSETTVAPRAATLGVTDRPSTPILLCDAARHERSGVQLF